MRYSGLSPGARLQLTLLSKSPSVVNVALQLPVSQPDGSPGARLTDKFPSDTTLWLVLRKFEAGVVGQSGTPRNLTGKSAPKMGANSGNSEGMYYERPVLESLGRSWDSFTDLQKTLAQLGFLKGNVLLRLSFRKTDTPLVEAMQQIEQYFKAKDDILGMNAISGPAGTSCSRYNEATELEQATRSSEAPTSHSETKLSANPGSTPELSSEAAEHLGPYPQSFVSGLSSRPATVFAPPASNTPQAARMVHDPQDFVPTVEHAKAHQALLGRAGANRRLLSDAEIAAQEAERAEKLSATENVDIKLRFQDQSSVVATFSSTDTTEDLFQYVQGLLAHKYEPFGLQYAGQKGNRSLSRGSQKLIADLGMSNRVLITVFWESGTSADARSGRSLKEEVAAQGRQIVVQASQPPAQDQSTSKEVNSKSERSGDKSKKVGVPKWLKLPGKK